jgi:tetratricopeptide (TPR) repeat protein
VESAEKEPEIDASAPAALICATSQSLKSVLRNGAKQAGVLSAMILEKTAEVLRELKLQPKSWLLLDFNLPQPDLAKILTAAQGANLFATRPIYLVAQSEQSSAVSLALEFNVAKLKFGDINIAGIEKDLRKLRDDIKSREPMEDIFEEIQKHTESNNFEEVSKLYSSVLAKHPENLPIKLEYLDFLLLSNDLKKAKSTLETLTAKDQADIRVRHQLARYYMRTKNYAEGIRLLETLDKENPWSAQRLIELGNALLSTSKFSEARDRFDQALTIQPENREAKVGQAKSTLLSGEMEKGFELLRNLGTPRQMASILNTAAVFASRSSRFEDARELYEKGIQLISEEFSASARLWYNLGILERRTNHLDRSLQCFKNAISADSSFLDAKHNLKVIQHLINFGPAPSSSSPAGNNASTQASPVLVNNAKILENETDEFRDLYESTDEDEDKV